MEDKVKLVIEIPKEDYLKAKRINWANIRPECVDDYEYQIAHGTPLDDVKAKIKRMEYHMIDCDVLVSQEEVLEIIDSIGERGKE